MLDKLALQLFVPHTRLVLRAQRVIRVKRLHNLVGPPAHRDWLDAQVAALGCARDVKLLLAIAAHALDNGDCGVEFVGAWVMGAKPDMTENSTQLFPTTDK